MFSSIIDDKNKNNQGGAAEQAFSDDTEAAAKAEAREFMEAIKEEEDKFVDELTGYD
eukprot:CAMPEP_0176338550 /NCGR_PEP_ID=MMETSP0126-20121128/48_1 /TAXON_ID=141414 ORGANISM="Strombidinopsis acuminatum, Strain SPMC142" /NCGR_SAMPLE_ID=MMETSP0126 /ASSEMBLY_ACC=CAM_ASM_000229 /LENGTH=56 /DNA_ID=CAMNT_0017681595 /DNA_START=146 /DNA_END=316 /DNA_ORIENTATION=+